MDSYHDNEEKMADLDNGTKVIMGDPYLKPYADVLRNRYSQYQLKKTQIQTAERCSLVDFASAYKYMGIHQVPGGIRYREWAPNAFKMSLVGDFNDWNNQSHPMEKRDFGFWEIFLPLLQGDRPAIPHNSKVKVYIWSNEHTFFTRIPPWINYAIQEPGNQVYDGIFWNPPEGEKYIFRYPPPKLRTNLKIYEVHIGMSSDNPSVGSYKQFKDHRLQYVADMKYDVIQLMAVMEHAYYASFGYQVTNFFAPSSRFGTPEDLKNLVDEAHRLGLGVFLDVVHSHASKNSADGLNLFDGSEHGYFHDGDRGSHPLWDSRLFNYSSWEVTRFLLSNLRYWVDEFHFDGFRFDGITSMIYNSHGLGPTPMSYDEYFGPDTDSDALLYLTLANDMLHTLNPNIITIAEEVSGLPTLCRPCHEGGIGFDYRLGMGVPDKWIQLMKIPDEDWNMGNIAFTLTNHRWNEATIVYTESHDQAMVGDKTIAFWLMDKSMYWDMTILKERNSIIDRGVALHKMIRFITMSLGGEGYLTFMGNEFGHPEWIDFPRSGNNWSYHHAWRRWYLIDDKMLVYKFLRHFELEMNLLENKYQIMKSSTFVFLKHEDDKIIGYERGDIVLIFNFHHSKSYTKYRIGVSNPGDYKIILDSDWKEFGGYERNDRNQIFSSLSEPFHNRTNSIFVYIPSRVAIAYYPVGKSISNKMK